MILAYPIGCDLERLKNVPHEAGKSALEADFVMMSEPSSCDKPPCYSVMPFHR